MALFNGLEPYRRIRPALTRAYEANITAMKAGMDMQMKIIQIGSK